MCIIDNENNPVNTLVDGIRVVIEKSLINFKRA